MREISIRFWVGFAVFFLLVHGDLLSQQTVRPTAPSAAAPKASPLSVMAMNDAFADVYDKVSPSVVIIEVQKTAETSTVNQPPTTAWDYFFKNYQEPSTDAEAVPFEGSGFIISGDGLIVTNYHVVTGARDNGIEISLHDGRKFPAVLLGADAKTDIALLKIDAVDLPAAELGDSDNLRVGNFAFAIGAPFALPYTFTYGIVSAKGRNRLSRLPIEDFIQTDASINPGNSGGPLVDIHGRVVGVNTLIYDMNRGLGFAVPINLVKNVLKQLVENGRVVRSWLGISILGLREGSFLRQLFPHVQDGVLVNAVFAGTPAHQSDLRPGDLIVEVDGEPVATSLDLQRVVMAQPIGGNVKLKVLRGNQTASREITITTAEQPGVLLQTSNRLRRQSQRHPMQRLPSENLNHQPTPPSADSPLFGLDVFELDAVTIRQTGRNLPVGLLVKNVAPDSLADAAGLLPGDIIVQVGEVAIRNAEDFVNEVMKPRQTEGALILIHRGEQSTFAILKN
ncbi:MAG: trypsin-like peptidase domain-containing protein [Chthoniobacterales bacterium]